MTFYFFKFGYIGSDFTGYQRGNGRNSVEDNIDKILAKNGIDSKISSAARTDRGVSALGNVFMLETSRKPTDIAGILNSSTYSIFIRGYAQLNGTGMNPRHCTLKMYRYFIFNEKLNCKDVIDIAKLFIGTHDFSHFSKKDSRNPVRTIDRIECGEYGNALYLDFFGKSFVWNQIRSIVGYVIKNINAHDTRDPFSLEARYPYISDATGLILMDIFYEGITFIPIQRKNKKLEKILEENLIKSYIISNVTDGSIGS
ncbi:MAG: hypothetical protein ACP5UV_00380 [Thermoplasmata archaeon]